MKNLILLLFTILICSCGKQKDKYRIIGLEVKLSTYNQGPNYQCIDLTDSVNLDLTKLIVVRFNFLKEYYSDENSQMSFGRASNYFSCEEKISQISFSYNGKVLTPEFLQGDTSITGVFPRLSKTGPCQSNNCDCWPASSFTNINQLINRFNTNTLYEGHQCQGCYGDKEPFIFLIDPKNLTLGNELLLKANIIMDNKSDFTATSNKLKLLKN